MGSSPHGSLPGFDGFGDAAVTARAIECGMPGGVARRTMGGTPRAGVATAAQAVALRGVSIPCSNVGVEGRAVGWGTAGGVGALPKRAPAATCASNEESAPGRTSMSGRPRSSLACSAKPPPRFERLPLADRDGDGVRAEADDGVEHQ